LSIDSNKIDDNNSYYKSALISYHLDDLILNQIKIDMLNKYGKWVNKYILDLTLPNHCTYLKEASIL